MAPREEFWEIVELLGLPLVRRAGVGGSLYADDVAAVAEAVGVAYQGDRTRTWGAVIERLGGVVDREADISTGGTIERHGLAKVRDLLLSGAALGLDEPPTPPVAAAAIAASGAYEPADALDERTFTARMIAQRQGQPMFRRALWLAYGRCVVTGCIQYEALEAAHIDGYKGPQSNHVTNGLLLRADVHTLFDMHLLTVDTTAYTIVVSEKVTDPGFVDLHGSKLLVPPDGNVVPSAAALDAHRAASGL